MHSGSDDEGVPGRQGKRPRSNTASSSQLALRSTESASSIVVMPKRAPGRSPAQGKGAGRALVAPSAPPHGAQIGLQKLECALCSKTSDKAPWHQVTVVIMGGKRVEVPQDVFCQECGVLVYAHPGQSDTAEKRAAFAKRYHGTAAFRAQVDSMREAARGMKRHIMQRQEVQGSRSIGAKVTAKVALVTLPVFAQWFQQPAESIRGLHIVKAYTPSNSFVSGALLSMDELPEGMPFFELEMYADVTRVLHTTMLSEDEILTESQAAQKYDAQCRSLQTNLGLEINHLTEALSAEDIRQKIQVAQQALLEKQALQHTMADAAPEEMVSQQLSLSTLDADHALDRPPAEEPKRKQRKCVGGAAAGSSSTAFSVQRSGNPRLRAPPGVPTAMEPGQRRRPGNRDTLASEGRIKDLVSVMNGNAVMRELKRHEHKLKNDSFENDEERDETLLVISACKAAQALWMGNISKMSMGEVRKNVATLALNNVDLPHWHKQLITWKYSSTCLSDGNVEGWLQSLDAALAESWSAQTPTFGSCWAAWGDEEPPKDCPRVLTEWVCQGQRWLNAIFNTAWYRAFNNTDRDGGKMLLEYNLRFLSFCDESESKWPAELQPFLLTARRTCRGLVALLSPLPRHAGSSPQDVDYLHCPMSAKSPVVDDLDKVGKLLAARLRKADDPIWPRLLSEYRQHVGVEETIGKEVALMTEKAREMKAVASSEPEKAGMLWEIVQPAVENNLGMWRQNLRSGATDVLEEATADMIARDIDSVANAYTNNEVTATEARAMLANLQSTCEARSPHTCQCMPSPCLSLES